MSLCGGSFIAVVGDADRTAEVAAKVVAQSGGKITSAASGPMSGIGATSYPTDYRVEKPSREDLIAADKQIDPLVLLTSPVFLSKDKNNKLVRGLGPVPTGAEGRPVLLVGNHQLIGTQRFGIHTYIHTYIPIECSTSVCKNNTLSNEPGGDLAFIVRQFLREKNTLVRGLAHPAIFTDGAFSTGDENRREDSMQSMFKKFGAVPVSPGSIYEVHTTGHLINFSGVC